MTLRRSLFWSFLQRYFGLATSAVTLPILSRLLTPEEIGIYSVAFAFVALAHAVRDFGIGDYLIQERDLTPAHVRSAFGISLVIGWCLGALLIGLSGPISWLYDEPGLRRALQVLGLNFVLIPISLPVLALLRRNMAFALRARILMTSSFMHSAVAIGLAFAGFGYMSLAWASLAGVLTTAVLCAWHRPKEMGWRPSFAEWRGVASFGGLATGTALVRIVSTHAPDFVLGRVLGFGAVGLYSRGNSLLRLFNDAVLQAVRPVVLPALSARHRAGGDLEGAYLKAVAYLTGLAWPFFGFVGLMAYPTIRIAFGPQWDAAVPVAQILCLAAAISMPWQFANHLLISVGRIGKEMAAQALTTPVQFIVLVILAFHSIEAAALAAVFRETMLALVRTYFIRSHLGFGLFDILRATTKSLGLAAFTCAVPAAVLAMMDIGPDNLLAPFAIALLGAGASWLLGLFLLDHPLRGELVLGARGLRPFLLRSAKRARGTH